MRCERTVRRVLKTEGAERRTSRCAKDAARNQPAGATTVDFSHHVTSILSVFLLALHISQDIVLGMDRGGLNHLVGVAILLLIVCAAVLLRERPSGKVIMPLGGVMAAGMLPLHMRNGLRPEFLEKSGALLFVWTLYVLGVSGAFSVILAVQALRARRFDT